MKKHLFFFLLLLPLMSSAQKHDLSRGVAYMGELQGDFSNGKLAPFWFTANKYGLSSIQPYSGYLRGRIERKAETDSVYRWKYGYGVDIAVPINHTRHIYLQQLYADIQWINCRLTVGMKEISQDFLNPQLSTGGMTLSNNATPIPQVRIETPNWWKLHFTKDWLSLKGHIAYGFYTDGMWQQEYVITGSRYTKNSLFHSKAGYLRIGNERKFPLTLTAGIVFACQFGGYGYNIKLRTDNQEVLSKVNLGNSAKDFWNAFIPGGSDVTDGNYANASGNHTGNWYCELQWKARNWSLKAYAQHFFEDHSQLFMQYNWRDMLWGAELQLPKNPVISGLVVEYLRTDDQTGGLYHDANNLVPDQISGNDNYYNHQVYGAWQHWGQNMGNAMILSPIYNTKINTPFSPATNGMLRNYFNRVRACHIGFNGNPSQQFNYRLLYTHLKTCGTYSTPLTDIQQEDYLLTELTFKPKKLHGWSLTASYGFNMGDLIGNSHGGYITIRKTGFLGKE